MDFMNLQKESLFFNDEKIINESIKFTLLPKYKEFDGTEEAAELRQLVQEAEEIINKHELSFVDVKEGWRLAVRLTIIYTEYVYTFRAISAVVMNNLFAYAATVTFGLINRIARFGLDQVEYETERKYAVRALKQLKEIEKRVKGKDKQEISKCIDLIQGALNHNY